MLNSEIAKILDDLGHTDYIVIGDLGLPVPKDVKKIDVALEIGKPAFIDILQLLIEEMAVEKVTLATEIKEQNPQQLAAIEALLTDKPEMEFVSHETFKVQTQAAKAVIRTGEATPFSNIILQSGVIF